MNAALPSEHAFVKFISVDNMMRLIHRIGLEPMLAELVKMSGARVRRQFESLHRNVSTSVG